MVVGIGAYTANIYNQITVMYDIYLFRLQLDILSSLL